MRKYLYLLLALLFAQSTWAQEKLLYSTDFQNWDALTSATEQTVSKTTDFSAETLTFKFNQVTVAPTGRDETRFNYTLVSTGYARAEKIVGSYMELSPLNSITKVVYQHGATGSSRGFKLWKKGASDADWVAIYSTYATPSSGQEVSVDINESNVAIKFTNLNESQNAYMFSLKIYGNYVSTNPQYPLTTSLNIPEAGTVTKTPNSDQYDQGASVSLQATPTFGYKFVKWVDSTEADLSTTNPYVITVNSKQKIKAVFEAKPTYSFDVAIAGSTWGQVQLTPQPTNGKYEEGTEVLMKVVPNPVTNFSYWEDNSTAAERTVTVNGNKSFTATFDEVPFIVGWNFKALTPTQSRPGDFYSETTNTGLISSYEPTGSTVGWLANASAFSPPYPNVRFWTLGADFKTKRRYLKAQFSTAGYKNIQVKSMVSANYQAYSVQVLQYSLDDVTYTELARVDITSVYNTGWKDLNSLLPVEAEGKAKVYIRWIADETSPILNEGTDNDGTAFTNVFVFADKEIIADTQAPVLISTVPVEGSATASINGSVVLTFDEKVKVGTGDITLGSTVLTGAYGSKTVTFKYEKLNYNTEYTFTVPAGALTDLSGNAFAGITLKFKTGVRLEPAKKLFDAVVAQDGSGDYTSVISAIAAAPASSATPWVIFIKSGKYTGHHDIPSNKPFIHLIGQHRDSVIISDNRLSGNDGKGTTVYHVSQGATMVVNSSDCYFENIIFENSYGYESQAGPQALALYTPSNHFTMNNCYLRSYQDTYLTSYSRISDRHYIKNSKIEGAVDFIYGGGDVFFDNSTITVTRKDGGYIVAPSHGSGTLWGYVFSNCTIDQDKVSGTVTTYYGRPWQNSPKTVFLNTTLKANIYPTGWYYKMGAIPAVFADYGTMDAAGNPVDLSQRISNYEYDVKDADGNVTSTVKGTAKSSLTDAEAATYTYENVIMRSGDTWDPRMISEAPGKPSNVQISGFALSWDNVAYTRLYIVIRDGKVIAFTTNTQYTDANPVAGKTHIYAVQAVSEYGALSTKSDEVIARKSQTITFAALPAKSVSDADFEAGATASSGLAVSLSSSNTAVADIVNGKIHIIATGTTTITASQAGDTDWQAATAVSRDLLVGEVQQSQTITFNALPAKNVSDADFEAGATASSGLAVSLSSSNSEVATIVNGKIHIVGAGTTSITASQAGNTSWLAATPVSKDLVVSKLDQTITFNAFTPKNITSDDFAAGATASSGLALSYTSSNTAVARVVNGIVEITGAGSTDITATQTGNTQYAAASPITQTLVVANRFKLPANNFQVKASDEICSSGNDGKINITAAQNLAYKASVVINGTNTVLPFTTALEIPSLTAGNYKVCITVDGQADYSQCFDLTVREPQALSMYSVVKPADNTVALNLAGSERYLIQVNDKSYQTTLGSVTLPLTDGMNKITVSTEKECQGTIEKSIFLSNGHTIYPNPFDQNVFINMGNDTSLSADVTLTDLGGARKYAALQNVQNGVVQVSLSDLPEGMYIIRVKTSLSESSTKILKK
jgi:pectin methylesterase-like acyl-CoA thioesterase